MPEANAYLFFNGNCAEAMKFYEKTLGGKLTLMTGKESPVADQMPPGAADLVLHARLAFDGGVLMASDDTRSGNYQGMHGFAVALGYGKTAEAKRIFELLTKGGNVAMPFEKTFWADGFGMATDRFGTFWMVSGPAPV